MAPTPPRPPPPHLLPAGPGRGALPPQPRRPLPPSQRGRRLALPAAAHHRVGRAERRHPPCAPPGGGRVAAKRAGGHRARGRGPRSGGGHFGCGRVSPPAARAPFRGGSVPAARPRAPPEGSPPSALPAPPASVAATAPRRARTAAPPRARAALSRLSPACI